MSAIRNTRHFYAFEEAVFTEDVTYYKRYLNDVGGLDAIPLQNNNAAVVGIETDETYYRRHLNDIS